jgi:hypothetical protein
MEIATNISQIYWCSYDLMDKKKCPIRENKGCSNQLQCKGEPILNHFEPAIINTKNLNGAR